MTVKERVKEYISFKKISEREFCRAINVAGTYVNSIRVSIQPDKLQRIALHFPDLNTEWLLTGDERQANDRNSRTMERMLDLLCEKEKLNIENAAEKFL